jgi:23S rRNA pseudouridine2457 synthase
MPELLLFNKPFGVLSQFSEGTTPPSNGANHPTLAEYIRAPGFYPAGRLDRDSEGLMILTDHGPAQARIADPQHKLEKTYWVQVEGVPDESALDALRHGVMLKEGLTRPAQARRLAELSEPWPRDPPIRSRQHIPTHWIELRIQEGRNRQVRRMTAAVGHPTLRLIRIAIGAWSLLRDPLAPGESRRIPCPAAFCGKSTHDSGNDATPRTPTHHRRQHHRGERSLPPRGGRT